MAKLLTACLSLILCICLNGCNGSRDEDQVQVATDAADFKPFASPPPSVQYGPYSLKVMQTGAIIAWEEKTWLNDLRHVEVSVTGLSPATQYCYRVNGAAKDGRFVTAPADKSPFSFFILGDTQTDPDVSRQIAARMLETDPAASFALHMGDLTGNGDDMETWECEWWDPMADFMLYLPVYPVMGNHDGDASCFLRYFGILGDNSTNYSFDWGSVHFIVLDVTGTLDENSDTVTWLKKELEEIREAVFTVVCHHMPPYLSTTADDEGSVARQEILVPIYERYGVALVLSGDMHGYQHHFTNNIHYVISAGGGGRLYDYGLPLEGMTLQLEKTHNFSRCSVEATSLHFITYDIEGNILDDFIITKRTPENIQARIELAADKSEVAPGESFTAGVYMVNAAGIDNASLSLSFCKDEPMLKLVVADADTDDEPGVQITKGELGGEVVINQADNSTGIITYKEKGLAGLSDGKTLIASASFTVPPDARATAFYLVPHCTLTNTAGKNLPHFMGGAKIVVKKN